MYEGTEWLKTLNKCSQCSHGDMVQSGSAESSLWGRTSRRPFPGKCFLHLHTGLQVQWWFMMSTAVLTSLNTVILKLSRLQTLLSTYQIQEVGSIARASSSGLQALYFLAWGSFLSSYDPSHCPLTQQGHKHRYSHCLAILEPHWGCTTNILKHYQTVTFPSTLLYKVYLEKAY